MSTMAQVVDQARDDLARAQVGRDSVQSRLDSLSGAAKASRSRDPYPAGGRAAFDSATLQMIGAQRAVDDATAKVAALEAEVRSDAEADRLSAMVIPTGTPGPYAGSTSEQRAGSTGRTYERTWRIGNEPATYRSAGQRRAGDPSGPSWLADLYAAQVKRDPAAAERLARHGREVEASPMWGERAMGTGAVSGFVPPQFLMELWAELARAGRPVANIMTALPLPERGMVVTIPRVTTGTIVASQATENAAVATQDLDDTLLQVPVVTVAGYTDLSRQSLERAEMVEQIVFMDLMSAYSTELDRQIINGTGASGQHLGLLNVASINAITYTDATPTASELWPKLADALGKIQQLRYTGATAFVMAPTTWAWLQASLDNSGHPFFAPLSLGWAAYGTNSDQPMNYDQAAVGHILGVPVIVSGNVPVNLGGATNETRIIAVDTRDIFLMEDQGGVPFQLRFDDVLSGSLGVRLLAYGYSSFAGGRQPKAISVISGTGLITPAL